MPYADPAKQLGYQRRWMQERRARAIRDRGGVCQACGSAEHLEWHHRDPDEKSSHHIWSWSWNRINAELAKCELLCQECHLTHTREFLRAKALTRERHAHGYFLPVTPAAAVAPRKAPGVAAAHGRGDEEIAVA